MFVSLDKIDKEYWPLQSALCAKNAARKKLFNHLTPGMPGYDTQPMTRSWYEQSQTIENGPWTSTASRKLKSGTSALVKPEVFWIAYMPNSYTSDAQLTPSPRLFHLSWNLALPPALLALLFCCEGICWGEKRSPLTYRAPWALAIQHWWTIVLLSKNWRQPESKEQTVCHHHSSISSIIYVSK